MSAFKADFVAHRFWQPFEQPAMFSKYSHDGRHVLFDARESFRCRPFNLGHPAEKGRLILCEGGLSLGQGGLSLRHGGQSLIQVGLGLIQVGYRVIEAAVAVLAGHFFCRGKLRVTLDDWFSGEYFQDRRRASVGKVRPALLAPHSPSNAHRKKMQLAHCL